jgi:hypothetical protein
MAIPQTEINDRFQKAVDSEYWRKLSPGMGIMDRQDTEHIESADLSLEKTDRALANLAKLGYFQLPAVIAPAVIARMCSSVEAVRHAGWPAVFSFVYDEFWAPLRTPSMIRLLSRQLGAGYLQTASVWTHYIDPRMGASGWHPHTDSSTRRNTEFLTVWIPLTDASVGNGCMHVIAQDGIPPSLPENFQTWISVSSAELNLLLHNVIPLPAARGSVLGWNSRLIHWGGRALDSTSNPRISIAVEFLHEETSPHQIELPVFDARLPSLEARLRVIGQAIIAYRQFEPLMHKYFPLAFKLMEWGSSDRFVKEQKGILAPEELARKMEEGGEAGH